MDKVEVKVTWGFVWAIWWRMALIGLAIYAVIGVPLMMLGFFATLAGL